MAYNLLERRTKGDNSANSQYVYAVRRPLRAGVILGYYATPENHRLVNISKITPEHPR